MSALNFDENRTGAQASDQQAKVAKILGPYSVAINRGLQHGVSIGDRYVIGHDGHAVTDPETGSFLGVYYSDGLRLKVTDIYDRVSVLSTIGTSGRTFTVHIGDECKRESL